MGLTGAQLGVLVRGHAQCEADATARSMAAIRAAVWADRDGFDQALDAIGGAGARGGGDDRREWLMGYDDEGET